MATHIYIDESGFTGPDLLSLEQPNFIVASTITESELSRSILHSSFPDYQGDEFKFKNIWKSAKHRRRLPQFCANIRPHTDHMHIWRIHKRFTLFVKCIDYLIEPLFYQMGRDFYAPWYAQRYCNTVYRDITDSGQDMSIFTQIVIHWSRLARFPTEENLSSLERFFVEQAKIHPHPKSTILNTLQKGIDFFRIRECLNNFENTNEIQFTSVLAAVSWWQQKGLVEYHVCHDQSNNFFSQK